MNFRFQLKALTLEIGVNKGQKSYISKTDDSFSLTMIIGFSFKRIYGRMATSKTNTADSIKWFYLKFILHRQKIFVVKKTYQFSLEIIKLFINLLKFISL